MSMIKPYKKCKKCGVLIVSGDLCEDCKPITNADRIRQMTDEELAEWLEEHGDCKVCAWYKKECVKHVTFKRGVAEWIKQEVQNNDG